MRANLYRSKRRKSWLNVRIFPSIIFLLVLETKILHSLYVPENRHLKDEHSLKDLSGNETTSFNRDQHQNQTPNRRRYKKNYDLESLETTIKRSGNRIASNHLEDVGYLPDRNRYYPSEKEKEEKTHKLKRNKKYNNDSSGGDSGRKWGTSKKNKIWETHPRDGLRNNFAYTPNPAPIFHVLPPFQTNVTFPLLLNSSTAVSTHNPSILFGLGRETKHKSDTIFSDFSMSKKQVTNSEVASSFNPENHYLQTYELSQASPKTKRNVKTKNIEYRNQELFFNYHPHVTEDNQGRSNSCDIFSEFLSIKRGKRFTKRSSPEGGQEALIRALVDQTSDPYLQPNVKKIKSDSSPTFHYFHIPMTTPSITATEKVNYNKLELYCQIKLRVVEDSSNKIVSMLEPSTVYRVLVTSVARNVPCKIFLTIKDGRRLEDFGVFHQLRSTYIKCSRTSILAMAPNIVTKWSFARPNDSDIRTVEFRASSGEINYSPILILPVNTDKESFSESSSVPVYQNRKETKCALSFYSRLTPSLASWHRCADQPQKENDEGNEANRKVWEKVTEKLFRENVAENLSYETGEKVSTSNNYGDTNKDANIISRISELKSVKYFTPDYTSESRPLILDKIKRSVVVSEDESSGGRVSRGDSLSNNTNDINVSDDISSNDNSMINLLLNNNACNTTPLSITNGFTETTIGNPILDTDDEGDRPNANINEHLKKDLKGIFLDYHETQHLEEDKKRRHDYDDVQQHNLGEHSNSEECEDGWSLFKDRCFQLNQNEANWQEAEEICRGMGGHLASVTSPGVSQLLNSLIKMLSISPSTAFWIGATDAAFENAFTWTSGKPFGYADWFPGWIEMDGYNSQPSDDGLAEEDCVELRRSFRLATKGRRITHRFYWNDRNCDVMNNFICERRLEGVFSVVDEWSCNFTVTVTPGAPPALVTTPGFPSLYPPNLICTFKLEAPRHSTITLVFDAFHMESHPKCSFDRLEILEPETKRKKVICGDWTSKLKLLRYISISHQIVLTMKTDQAHSFTGFKIKALASTGGGGCGTRWQTRQNDTCLFVADDPQVTWNTASRICRESQGELVTLGDSVNLKWVNSWLKNHPRYSPDFRYWIGASFHSGSWIWEDRSSVTREITEKIVNEIDPEPDFRICLSLEATSSSKSNLNHQLYFGSYLSKNSIFPTSHFCDGFGGYICAKKIEEKPIVQNRTIFGTAGNLTSPEYPRWYPNDVHMTITLKGPPQSRLILSLNKLSLEYQEDCLYDYIEISSNKESNDKKRFCGHQPKEDESPVYVSKSNELSLIFHSDWSENGAGMVADWWAVDTSSCPHHRVNLSDNVVISPNFPQFNLADLHCTTIIEAPVGNKIWLQFEVFEVTTGYDEDSTFGLSSEDFQAVDASQKSQQRGIELSVSDKSDNDVRHLLPQSNNSFSHLLSNFPAHSRTHKRSSNSKPKRHHRFFASAESLNSSHQNQNIVRNLNNKNRQLNLRPSRLKKRGSSLGSTFYHPSSSSSSTTSAPFPTSPSSTSHLQLHSLPLSYHSRSATEPSFFSYNYSTIDKQYQHCTEDFVEIILAAEKSVKLCGIIPEGTIGNLAYISHGNILKIAFHTSKYTKGRGFKATYKIGQNFEETVVLQAINIPPTQMSVSNDDLYHNKVYQDEIKSINYPMSSTSGVKFTRHLVAPPGFRISITLYHVGDIYPHGKTCPQDYLEVEDWYAGKEGKIWRICSIDSNSSKKISIQSTFNSLFVKEIYSSHNSKSVLELSKNKNSTLTTEEVKTRGFDNVLKLTLLKFNDSNSLTDDNRTSNDLSNLDSKEAEVSLERSSEMNLKQLESVLQSSEPLDTYPNKVIYEHTTKNKNNSILLSEKSIESNNYVVDKKQNSVLENNYFFPSTTPSTQNNFNKITFTKTLLEPRTSHKALFAHRTKALYESSRKSTVKNLLENTNSIDEENDNFYKGNQKQESSIFNFQMSYFLVPDSDWINRSLGLSGVDNQISRTGVASCDPSPCLNAGRCVTDSLQHSFCLCDSAYTGTFCQIQWCFVDPCLMGRCLLTGSSHGFECKCQVGWGGSLCDKKVSPCAGEPCQGRGECMVTNNSFSCRCHAWWEGTRCENRLQRIPYKPLSERMIEEPFWLGLITVAVVMGCIGIVFCIKKHFADKIEKFFAEEIERSKYGGVSGSRLHPLPSPTGLSPRPRPKSLLVRLNSFRKASLLSLSSTASSPPADGPSFSFDDFLKPHKRGATGGSSSPLRALSKPRSQNASPRIESKKILRHLMAPSVGHRAPSFDEFLNLRTQSSKCSVVSEEFLRLRSASPELPSSYSLDKERTLSADISELRVTGSLSGDRRTSEGETTSRQLMHETSLICLVPSPTKQDKKVTFAKLMSKMQKELSSSSSDMSAAEDKVACRAMALAAASAAKRSPRRSPRLRHTNRFSGSGSEEIMETPDISSSEMTPDPQKRLLTIKSASSPSSKTSSPQNRSKLMKISSADSLLAMFRSLGGTARSSLSSPTSPHGSELDDSSAQCSPSTTPTTPPRVSPVQKETLVIPGNPHQVEVHGQSGSTQSSGPSITLEVPTEQYRCLSPITELPSPMPTPMPSPLPTPSKYHMQQVQKTTVTTSSDSSAQDNNTAEDTESEFSISICMERSSSDSSGSEPRAFFSIPRTRLGSFSNGKKEPLLSPSAKVTISSPCSSSSHTPTNSPLASPKTKYKPPPLSIPNSNLLNFNTRTDSSLLIPVICIQDADGDILAHEHFDSTPRTRSQSIDVGSVLKTPLITICCVDDSPPSSSSSSSKSDPSTASFIVPTLNVTIDSPPSINKSSFTIPTIKIEKQCEIPVPKMFRTPNPPFRRRSHNQIISLEKTNSLDSSQAPMITVTAVMSEADSDLDTPLEKMAPNTGTARFLSPLLAANIHNTSEGNLSSSGYSSAYSPGPSRCSSNNRLCSGEGEEPLTPSVTSIPSKPAVLPLQNMSPAPPPPPIRIKRRLFIKPFPTESASSSNNTENLLTRTDSETTDDLGMSSQPEQDSALELDTNDEFQEAALDSLIREIDLDLEAESQRQKLLLNPTQIFSKEPPNLQRPPPVIVVHNSLKSESSVEECTSEKPSKLSPVSSRSESPISDSRLSVHRIYPAFFSSKGKLDMPYTDSDGLYDCPSSEVLHSDSTKSIPQKRLGRRKTKRAGKLKSILGTVSGENVGKLSTGHLENCYTSKRGSSLELPPWEHRSPRKSCQKRRQRAHTSVDILSSSSDSITSQSATIGCPSPVEILSDIGCLEIGDDDSSERSKLSGSTSSRERRCRRSLVRGESISCRSLLRQGSFDASGEETQEDQVVIKSSKGLEEMQRHKKVSRFRSFSNQLRKRQNACLKEPLRPPNALLLSANMNSAECLMKTHDSYFSPPTHHELTDKRFIRRLQHSRIQRAQQRTPSGSSDSDPECIQPEANLTGNETSDFKSFGRKVKVSSKSFPKNSKKIEPKYKMVVDRKVRSS